MLLLFTGVISSQMVSAQSNDAKQTSIAIEALSRLKGLDLEQNPALNAAVLKVLDQVRGKPEFVQIVRDFKIKGREKDLLEFALKNPDDSAGVEAMRLILAGHELDSLKAALRGTNCSGAIKSLGNTRDKEIVPLLLPLVTDAMRDAASRKLAVTGLAQVQEGAAGLLELVKEKKLPDDLKWIASSELNSARWPSIKTKAAELLPLPQSSNSETLPPISELVKLKGDPAKGAAVFRLETVGCIKCHQVNGEGIDFGPSLSEIGTKLGKDAIYESILDPSAGISFGYEAWQFELKNGDEILGLIASETADEVAVKVTGGIVTHYKKADIVKRQKQALSIMPTGLQQTMSREQLVDLVEYLTTLKASKAAVERH